MSRLIQLMAAMALLLTTAACRHNPEAGAAQPARPLTETTDW